MSHQHPFRFATFGYANSRAAWVEYARKVESLGYATLLTWDHLSGLAPIPALLSAAEATSTLRVGIHVLANDYRHPAWLAHEAATVDLLSDGRLELGLGAGWAREDYESTGLTYDPPGVRIERLAEAVTLIKRLWQEDVVTHTGKHYHTHALSLEPKPLQRPHPPIMIGGSGKRILSLAAQEATIVGLSAKSTRAGQLDASTMALDAVAEKVQWIREAAGMRFNDLELHIAAIPVIDDNRQRGAEIARAGLQENASYAINTIPNATDLLDSPHAMIGSIDQIVETLQERRERYGISYITMFGDIDTFAPVVARLAGQ